MLVYLPKTLSSDAKAVSMTAHCLWHWPELLSVTLAGENATEIQYPHYNRKKRDSFSEQNLLGFICGVSE